MSHMNSLQIPATAIFTALLFIIMVSASRFTYTLAPAKESSVACRSPQVREAPAPRVCSLLYPAQHWPPYSTIDFAAPNLLLAEPSADARALEPGSDADQGPDL